MSRVAEPGNFTVFTGGSSVDTKQLHFRLETVNGRSVSVPATCASVPESSLDNQNPRR
jgi:hypothetical protein